MGIDVHHPTPAADRRFLQEVIRTVSSTLDLEQVLRRSSKLIVEAHQVRTPASCGSSSDRGQLVLRAASEHYAAAVGVIAMAPGEGLAGWVAAAPRTGLHPAGRARRPARG